MVDFFRKVRDFFTKLLFGNTEDFKKNQELREIFRELKKEPFAYYRANSNEVLPNFARAVYKFALSVTSLSDFFQKTILNENQNISEIFKNYLVESRLDDNILSVKNNFTQEAMSERLAGALSLKGTLSEIEREFNQFLQSLQGVEFSNFDREFTQLDRLAALSQHDFEKILSFFNPDITLSSPNRKPVFNPAIGLHMINDLMDIYFLFAELDLEANTEGHVIQLYEKLKNQTTDEDRKKLSLVISSLVSIHKNLLSGDIILKLIKAINRDPSFIVQADRGTRTFMDLYMSKLLSRFELNREKAIREHNERSVKEDIKRLFGDMMLFDSPSYSEDISNLLSLSGLGMFNHLTPFQVLKTFLIIHFEPHIKETIKKLVINSFFENKTFKDSFINQFHSTQSAIEKMTAFENNLAEPGEATIPSIKEYLSRHEKGKQVTATLSKIVDAINSSAAKLIENIINDFASFSHSLQTLIEDATQHTPAIISNIRVIGGERNREFLDELARHSKLLVIFVDIMRHFTVIRPNVEDKRE
ncbi:MAG: hypothetical protein EHM28_08635 [Spirochaetaceae bacterium]|nr:MAG: hypothetical protein EHM28_08635 [Spirochaetaceae bacterium]